MKITGKDYIKIEGAEGTKHPMYIKGSAEGFKSVIYLADARTSGYVRRKVGNAWIYMHKEDVAIQKASQQTETPTTRLKKQNAELQKQVAQFQKDEAKRVSAEEKKKTRAAQNKLISRINRKGKPTPAETIAALKAEIAALREGNEMLSEINAKLEADLAERETKNPGEDSDYRTWYEDELAAENEILRGQNNSVVDATKAIALREGYLAHPEIGGFVDRVAEADNVEISSQTVVQGNRTDIVLRARITDAQK